MIGVTTCHQQAKGAVGALYRAVAGVRFSVGGFTVNSPSRHLRSVLWPSWLKLRAAVCPFILRTDRPPTNRPRTNTSVLNGPQAKPDSILVRLRPRRLRRSNHVVKWPVVRHGARLSEQLVVRLVATRAKEQPQARLWAQPPVACAAARQRSKGSNNRPTPKQLRLAVRMRIIGRSRH